MIVAAVFVLAIGVTLLTSILALWLVTARRGRHKMGEWYYL